MAHLLAVIILELHVEPLPLSKQPSIMFFNLFEKSTSNGDELFMVRLVTMIILKIHVEPLALSKQLKTMFPEM